jgi:hypothetical protein
MTALYDRAFNPRSEAGHRADAAGALESLEARAAELERRLAAARRFGAFSPPAIRASQVREVLGPGEALVEFMGVEGQMHAVVVRHDRPVAVERLAGLEAIGEQAQRLSMTIDRAILGALRRPGAGGGGPDPPDAACARLLARLYGLLMAPIERHLDGADRLLLSPHDVLYAMPLHALMSGGRALVERFEVATIPSAALLWLGRSRPLAAAGGAPVVVGVPDDLAPEMGEEARAVAAALPGARLLVGTEATFAGFASAARDAPLIHLACHGVFPSRNPMQARVRFADGWVTVRDLLGLSLPGSVVVLSGCETGRSRVARGDEAYGLGRALLATGASAVVMSLWPVHDRTTRALMELVYQARGREYLSGPAPAGGAAECVGDGGVRTGAVGTDAVRAGSGGWGSIGARLAGAQRGLIARGAHPAMWAPFVVMGEPA